MAGTGSALAGRQLVPNEVGARGRVEPFLTALRAAVEVEACCGRRAERRAAALRAERRRAAR
jgi:hypothetical protein